MNVYQISRLGRFGSFGNQLFQYCAGKALARRDGCALEVPADWIGRRIFKIDDPPIGDPLPTLGCDVMPERPGVDLWGYYQHPDFFRLYSEADAQTWLCLRPEWTAILKSIPWQFRAHRRSYRGYQGVFCVVSEESYARAGEIDGIEIEEMVTDYCPQSRTDIPANIAFLWDFMRLMRSKVLYRGNSTFSWWAAVLGGLRFVSAPLVGSLTGPQTVPFAEGNWHPMVDIAKNCPDEPGRISGPYALHGAPGFVNG